MKEILVAGLSIFVSFEFDKDNDLKESFYRQAKDESPHCVVNCSLREAYPDEHWKEQAKQAIAK